MHTTNTNDPEKTGQTDFEMSDKDLDQVSGGFNPQPDPPARSKFAILSANEALPAVQNTLPAVQSSKKG